MKTIPLDEYVKQLVIEEAREDALEEGVEKKAFEVARSMRADGFPAEAIRKYTGLDEDDILALS